MLNEKLVTSLNDQLNKELELIMERWVELSEKTN